MRIIIDTNTLLETASSTNFIVRAGAINAVKRLAQEGHALSYYSRYDIPEWIETYCPPGDIVVYNDVIDKLETLYEREESAGSAILIDAGWSETLDAFQRLATGDCAQRVPHWQNVTAFLFGYLRLIAFGEGAIPLCGMFPATMRLEHWEDAETVLTLVSDHDKS